jgi:hypothetical protein
VSRAAYEGQQDPRDRKRQRAQDRTAIVMSGMIVIGIVAIDVLLRALQARIERHRQ